MKQQYLLLCLLAALALQSCDYAQSNVQTLYTNDCGINWELIPPGQRIPTTKFTCAYKVTIPAYPMQGEARFKTPFKNKVLAYTEVSYDYIITDGIKFVAAAKYLGKANTHPAEAENTSAVYETAENSVIDSRIKEISRRLLVEEDIVDFNQASFEETLLKEMNKLLAEKGIELNFISFVPIPEEQTRQAIDVVNATRIYKANGIEAVGAQVAAARAGATKITVNAPEGKAAE